MKQREWHNVVSGSKAGFAAALVRLLLRVAAFVYSAIIRVRNLLYSKGLLKSYGVTQAGLKTTDRSQATVLVISVGNITVGGTGKTPMVIWLCNFFRLKGTNCAVLTRGYKAAAGGQSDEPAVLVKNCPGTAVVVNPDRLAGAIEAVKRHRAKAMIMDDGFQHRRLHRDIDIVTIDATQPFGFSRMLPAGLLREPVTALKRANAAVLTRSDLVSEETLSNLEDIIRQSNPAITVARAVHVPVYVMTAADKTIPLEQLRGKKVFAFCGIANPEAFLAGITLLAAHIVGSKIYDDHYNYTAKDVEEILRGAAQSGAEIILTTEKDYNKINPTLVGKSDLVLAYLMVRLQFVAGEEQLIELIERSPAGRIHGKELPEYRKRYV